MSLKNIALKQSCSSHNMSQTMWEIPIAQPTTDFWTSVPFLLWRGYTPHPQGSSPNFCSHSFSVFFPPLSLSWGDVALTSFLKELGLLRPWWRRLVCFRQELTHTLIQTHTRPHNAHSFCFKHVNCFPSVLDTQPWKSSYHLWRSSAGCKGIPELKPGLKRVNLSPLFCSFKPLTAKHNPVQLFQLRECSGSVCCR